MSLASICCMIRRETDHDAGPGRGNPAATSPLMTRAPPLPSAPSGATRRSTVEPPNIADVLAQIPPGSITRVRLDLLHWTAMRPSQMGRLRAEDFRLDEPIGAPTSRSRAGRAAGSRPSRWCQRESPPPAPSSPPEPSARGREAASTGRSQRRLAGPASPRSPPTKSGTRLPTASAAPGPTSQDCMNYAARDDRDLRAAGARKHMAALERLRRNDVS